MKTVSECQARVSDLLNAINLLACTHEKIDGHLIEDYKDVPKPCLPEVLNDSEEPVSGSCPLKSEIQLINEKYREYAQKMLLGLAEVMKDTGGPDMQRVAGDVEEEAKKIDTGSGDLLLLPGITGVVSENTFRMFALFDVCMRE